MIINEQQAAFIEEEKEEITAEKIIEQELLKANLQPVTPIVPPAEKETIKPVQPEQVSQPVSKKTAPVKEKSPVPYLIAVIVVVCYYAEVSFFLFIIRIYSLLHLTRMHWICRL